MATKYKLVSGDVSGAPALYAARIDETTFAVYEINEWEDLDSSAVETHGKYNVQAGIVDVRGFDSHTQIPGYFSDSVRSALQSCGWEIDGSGNIWCPYSGDIVVQAGSPAFELCLVECLWQYGAKDVAADVSGDNLRKLVREARAAV